MNAEKAPKIVMQEQTRPGFVGSPKRMELYERTSSIRPAGVLATACTQWGPCATREVPAVIAVWINWTQAGRQAETVRSARDQRSRSTDGGSLGARTDLRGRPAAGTVRLSGRRQRVGRREACPQAAQHWPWTNCRRGFKRLL